MLNIAPGGTEVLLWVTGLCLTVTLAAYLYKRTFIRQSAPVEPTTYSRGARVFRLSGTIQNLALCLALGLAVIAINWTRYQSINAQEFTVDLEEDDFFEVIPPTTQTPPPPPPPPPPPLQLEPTPEPIEEEVTFVDNSIDEKTVITTPEPVPKEAVRETGPPPLPPPPPPREEPPIIFAERMPVFGADCRDLPTEADRKACSDRSLMKFLSNEIRYPSLARENGIEGRVVLQFTVEKDGKLSDVTVLRGLPGGLSEESLRVVNLIDEKTTGFSPGRQQGSPVRVRFTLPIQYKLN